jgi:hypothetical protein
MEAYDQNELVDAQVRRFFRIDDITLGTMQQGYLRRYRGHLLQDDSIQAYDQLTDSLKPYALTPLFRKEDGKHILLLVPAAPEPKPAKPWINALMFVLTLISVLISGGLTNPNTNLPSDPV